ncbi:hypothetical protein J5277_16425 [Rhizobium sp. 16-449-1b]|uniref:hypothetical protein n=1 Tax=Rhizobium sp. 16-449-1b TaxID=2819989 RepID=UPI001ADA7E7C|nr:hypothetical protein [Rhizobium sp. 16-449-1b]MBO9195693.1 hypothetical protein [Rhizobium sp. 16-449-1b]
MSTIDINRLRRFFADAQAAHAALMVQWKKVSKARENVSHAQVELRPYQFEKRGKQILKSGGEKFVSALAEAERDLKRADEEYERLQRAWEHAASLRNRVRDYAIQLGEFPSDLKD